jgi:hypothetical protein
MREKTMQKKRRENVLPKKAAATGLGILAAQYFSN